MSLHDVKYLLNTRKGTSREANQLLDILEPLIRIYSPTGDEKNLSRYILDNIRSQNRYKVETKGDEKDNIYNIYIEPINKNPTVLLNAHLDTLESDAHDVHRLRNVTLPRDYFNRYGLIKKGMYDTLLLGYDDKIGIAIILWLIKYRSNLSFKALFTVQEEACNSTPEELMKYKRYGRNGGVGIEYALEHHPHFFEDISTCFLIDRAEDKPDETYTQPMINPQYKTREEPSDIIYRYNGEDMCSSDFKRNFERLTIDLRTPMKHRRSGAKADAYNLKKRYESMDIVNLAAGGYKEHQTNDYLNIVESVRTLRVLERFIVRKNRGSSMNQERRNRPQKRIRYYRNIFQERAERCIKMIESNEPERTQSFIKHWNQIREHLYSINEVERGLNRFGSYRMKEYHRFFKNLKNDRRTLRLMYPGSGSDIFEPLAFLSEYIDEFYFVDERTNITRHPYIISTFRTCNIECSDYSVHTEDNIRYLKCKIDYQGNSATMYYFCSSWQDLYAWLIKNRLRMNIMYVFDVGGEGGVDFSLGSGFISDVISPILTDRFVLYTQNYPNVGSRGIQYGTNKKVIETHPEHMKSLNR